MMMEIAFTEISAAEANYTIVDDGWFPHGEVVVEKPVEGFFTIRRTDDKEALIKGALSWIALVACDRCSELVKIELDAEFTYQCVFGKEEPVAQPEVECREEDYIKIYLEESVITIGDILREQVLLTMPISVLCSMSCKGLCSKCGADLNSGECTCDMERVSSQFAALQQLKGR